MVVVFKRAACIPSVELLSLPLKEVEQTFFKKNFGLSVLSVDYLKDWCKVLVFVSYKSELRVAKQQTIFKNIVRPMKEPIAT